MKNQTVVKKERKSNNKGFTLMELIIVVAIIAILIALIAPALTGFLDEAETTSYASNCKNMYTSGSAWITHERVKGAGKSNFSVNVTKSGVVMGSYSEKSEGDLKLSNIIDYKSMGNAKAIIYFEEGKCSKVEWFANESDSTAICTYPES